MPNGNKYPAGSEKRPRSGTAVGRAGTSWHSAAQAASHCRLLPCPQLPYMVPPVHRDWFHGLGEMKRAMDEMEFDVAVIGAGAWSVPLAVHAKTQALEKEVTLMKWTNPHLF